MRRLVCWIVATVAAILLGAAVPSAAAQIEIRSGPGYNLRQPWSRHRPDVHHH